MERIVLNTPGYVGADLNALIDEALISSLDRRLMEQINSENQGNEFVSNLIEWIKKKLQKIQNKTDTDDAGVNQEVIEVNQSDFEVYFLPTITCKIKGKN